MFFFPTIVFSNLRYLKIIHDSLVFLQKQPKQPSKKAGVHLTNLLHPARFKTTVPVALEIALLHDLRCQLRGRLSGARADVEDAVQEAVLRSGGLGPVICNGEGTVVLKIVNFLRSELFW